MGCKDCPPAKRKPRRAAPQPAQWTHEDYANLRKGWGNNTLAGWKLTYTDGSVIRSTDMPFRDAPQDRVQVLTKYYRRPRGDCSREVQNGLDVYTLYSELPIYLELPAWLKKGENLTNERFAEVIAAARADREIVDSMLEPDRPEVVRAQFPGLRF